MTELNSIADGSFVLLLRHRVSERFVERVVVGLKASERTLQARM